MRTYIGIDLGTSGVKLLLVAADGSILREVSESYPTFVPQDGWSEQRPEDWFRAVYRAVPRLIQGLENTVKGISFSGQMHGLVILDEDDKVIRPCILWNDGRTQAETDFLNEEIGERRLLSLTGNIAFAGFTAPKLLWLQKHEPTSFAHVKKIMLPKDYLAFQLSGAFCTDYSDASGTLLFDVKKRVWSEEMCRICGIRIDQLPTLYESFAVVGALNDQLACAWNLPKGIAVVAGAGDNAAAAVGMGIVGAGGCNISLGTSGTLFLSGTQFIGEGKALHSFCHADGKWYLMGCILSAASARKWWLERILCGDYAKDEQDAADETADVFFLPYLSGERCPYNDVNARGAFIGLSATTTRGQMSRAVMEGVAFALRDCMEVAKERGLQPEYACLCGGGAKSRIWRQIMADVLELPIRLPYTEQGPAYGAALLAMVGCMEFERIIQVTESLVEVKEIIFPSTQNVLMYRKKYKKFQKLYPLLKDFYSAE